MSNGKQIENTAVTAVNQIINKSNILEPYISSNDKTPSWDGTILVNSSSPNNKKSYEKIPVQVKGKEVKIFSEKQTSYQFEVADLKNYFTDGGILIFVVEIEINTKETRIFYSSLLPIDLKYVLNKIKPNQKYKSIDLKRLNISDTAKIENICRNFLLHKNRQIGTINYSTDDFSKFEKFTIKFDPGNISPIEYVFENEVYLYGLEHKNSIPIPIKKMEIDEVSEIAPQEFFIGSEKFLYECTKILSRNGNYILIGNNIRFDLDNSKVTCKISGNLDDRIKDIKFTTALFNDKKIFVNFPNKLLVAEATNFDGKTVEQFDKFKNKLTYYNKIDALMRFFRISDLLEMDNLTQEEYNNLNNFIDIILYNKKIKYNLKITGFHFVKIGNLRILMFLSLDKNGYLCIENPYDIDTHGFQFTYSKTKETVKCSPYILLKSQYLKDVSNLEIDKIEKSIKSYEINDLYLSLVNSFLLELVILFDQNKKLHHCLTSALNLCNWLDEYEKSDYIINTINKFQILERQRVLQNNEIDELIKIKELSRTNFKNLCGINILLGNRLEFDYCFEKLSEEEKKEFCTYPIYNLLPKTM